MEIIFHNGIIYKDNKLINVCGLQFPVYVIFVKGELNIENTARRLPIMSVDTAPVMRGAEQRTCQKLTKGQAGVLWLNSRRISGMHFSNPDHAQTRKTFIVWILMQQSGIKKLHLNAIKAGSAA